MRRAAVVGALGMVVALWASPAGAAPEPRAEVTIRGTVRDEAGNPLADYPVRLIKTKTILNLLHFSTSSQQMEETRIQTDAEGRFELTRVPDPKYDYFYLRFYDPKTFDPVHYRVPADLDITRRFKQGPEVIVEGVVQIHPDWARVQELISHYGTDSNRGRILRALGLPERRETFPQDGGRENWWYYAKGLCYQLRDDTVLHLRRYDPVLPPGGAA